MRLALALLIACSGSPAPSTVAGRSAPVVTARATPAPTVAWSDGSFVTTQLPAIARAAELGVVALHDSDGGRGWPNLRLEVRDRSDRTLQTIEVMVSNDYEKLVLDGKPTAELARRIAAANRELAKLHGVHDLVAMVPLEVQPSDLPHFATGDGLDIDFARDQVNVFHHNVTRAFRTVNARGWLAPSGKRCAQCDVCETPAFLHAVYKAPVINALVVEIAYRGTDTCWEPGHQLHLVTW